VPAEKFAVDNVIIAVGQHASLAWLPAEFKNERGTLKVDLFGRLGNTNFFARGRHRAAWFGPATDGCECEWVTANALRSTWTRRLRGESLEARKNRLST